jgi:hypothetical protein
MNVDKKLVLTAVGIVGFGATVLVAIKNTKKVQRIYDKDQRMKSVVEGTGASQDISKVEWVKKYGKYYVPTLVMYAVSSACVVGAYKLSVKEIAALSGSLATVISQRDKIEAEARKQFGDEAVDKVKHAVIRDEALELDERTVYDTGKGKVLCYEGIIGQIGKGGGGTWFYSTEEEVRKAIETIQEWIKDKNYVGVDDLYKQLGIKKYAQFIEMFGWAPTQEGEPAYIPDFHICHDKDDDGTEFIWIKVGDPLDMPLFDYWNY